MSWKTLPFEECIEKAKIPYKLPKKNYKEKGNFPVISQESNLISGYHNNKEHIFNVDKPVIVFGDHTRVLKYIDFNFVCGADGVKIIKPISEIDTKFFYYVLNILVPSSKGYARHYKLLKDLKISFPPLTEQQRIVAKLDAVFTEIDTLNQINSIRKAELIKFKRALLMKTLSIEKSNLVRLDDVCELIYGKPLDKIDRLENDGVPAYGANGIKTYSTKALSDGPSIIIGRKGSAGELKKVSSAFWALDVTYYTKINHKLIDLDFLYYTLSNMNLPSMAKGVKPGINRNDVYKRMIYLPSLVEQKRIVSLLDASYKEIETVNDSLFKLKNNCQTLITAILSQELQSGEAA